MTRQPSHTVHPPTVDELLAGFLRGQTMARDEGIAAAPISEVELHDASATPPVDARLAWDDASFLLRGRVGSKKLQPPPDWTHLAVAAEPIHALAFAVGNFPQLVSDLPALIRSARRRDLIAKPRSPVSVTSLGRWTETALEKGELQQALTGIGAMRLVGQCDRAAGLLARLAERAGDDWASMIDNESAALAWHSGRIDEAVDLWNRAERSPAVVFNRGMAALFLDRPADAASALSEAVAMIPEDAAWHHLARLYLTLAGLTR